MERESQAVHFYYQTEKSLILSLIGTPNSERK